MNLEIGMIYAFFMSVLGFAIFQGTSNYFRLIAITSVIIAYSIFFISIWIFHIYSKSLKIIKENKITDVLSVGIVKQFNELKVRAIINGIPFLQCSLAVMQFTKEEAEDENTDNMDDHLKAHGVKNLDDYKAQTTIEEELFVHTSNIQAFVEYNYDVGILLESYSFPLLKKLSETDQKIEEIFYEQLTDRWMNGEKNQRIVLMDECFSMIFLLVINGVIPKEDFEEILKLTFFIINPLLTTSFVDYIETRIDETLFVDYVKTRIDFLLLMLKK